MRAYINYLPNLPQSQKVMERCAATCGKYGLEPIPFPAIWRERMTEAVERSGLEWKPRPGIDDTYSRPDAAFANFITNYNLWHLIEEPSLILEHDAVITAAPPEIEWPDITNVAEPSFGLWTKTNHDGIQRFFSGNFNHFKGAHGYIVTPEGAKTLIEKAQNNGAKPLDVFFHKEELELYEYHPWFVKAKDSFSTIQHKAGCVAKHNWGKDYEVL